MTYTWIYIMFVLMAANAGMQFIPAGLYVPGVFCINLLVLVIAYFIMKRDYFMDLRANMLFMVGLTAINILTGLGIMSYAMSWLAFGALFIWSMAGGGRSR